MMNTFLSHIVLGVILHLASVVVVEAANIGPDGLCALSTFVPFTSVG
jgi:hypothetical protein